MQTSDDKGLLEKLRARHPQLSVKDCQLAGTGSEGGGAAAASEVQLTWSASMPRHVGFLRGVSPTNACMSDQRR